MTHYALTITHFLYAPINELLNVINKIGSTVVGIYESILKARQINRGIQELNSLTDAELRDIGIGRGDIYAVASGNKDMVRAADLNIKVEVNENLKGAV